MVSTATIANTTALARDIDRQDEARRAADWDDRRAGHRRRPPKWAADHLLDVGAISADQHDAAQRYASAIERGFGGDPLPAGLNEQHVARIVWDTTFAAEVRRTQAALDRAQSREVARAARSWVRSLRKRRNDPALAVLDLLFGFNGAATGCRASWKIMRSRGGSNNSHRTEAEIVRVLEYLTDFWLDADLTKTGGVVGR